MATPDPYTNDTLPDIAYLLVFNSLSLQERLRLRVVCQRWKTIIEADCAQMGTLRVFGKYDHQLSYFARTEYRSMVPPTTEGSFKYDPSPMNTITLKPPTWDRVDVHFLARLFPAISHLCLFWTFGEQAKRVQEAKRIWEYGKTVNSVKFSFTAVLEPDILALLASWAPNLRSLILVTYSIGWDASGFPFLHQQGLNASQSKDFWNCLSLCAPTLEVLNFEGVDLRSAPQSLTLPALLELTHYFPTLTQTTLPKLSPEQLNRLAPALRSFTLPSRLLRISQRYPLVLPATVKAMTLTFDLSRPNVLQNVMTPSPSITHLKVQLTGHVDREESDFFQEELLAKFPQTTSLTILSGDNLHSWLIEKGKQLATPQPSGPFDRIEELTFCPMGDNVFQSLLGFRLNMNADDWFLYLFRGISAHFTGLKKLTLAIEPDSEVRHCRLKEILSHQKSLWLPKVELEFTLAMNAWERMLPFKVQSEGAVAYAAELSQCYLSPGCAFAPPIALSN